MKELQIVNFNGTPLNVKAEEWGKETKENQKYVIGIVNKDGWSDTWELVD